MRLQMKQTNDGGFDVSLKALFRMCAHVYAHVMFCLPAIVQADSEGHVRQVSVESIRRRKCKVGVWQVEASHFDVAALQSRWVG